MVAVAAILVWLRHTDADTEVTMMYEWTGEEKAQMELAIRERDITLVPKCTEEYYEWRSRTKETREELYGKGSPEL